MSAGQKEAITVQALGLLNEQIQARIVHYRGDLETNAELDAITAQVVAQLKAMQASVGAPSGKQTPEQMEASQVKALAGLLHKVFSSESQFTSRILKPLGRRIAKLFFESELHEKSKGDKEKTIFHAEQGVFYVLQRYKSRLRAELEGFDFSDEEVKNGSLAMLAKIERDLQVAFLSRRSPELNQVMTIFATVLSEFLQKHLPPRLDQIAKLVVRSANTARRPNSVPYKILVDAFGDFRGEWERVFMEQMVNFCGDELIARLTQGEVQFHAETVKFFSDPHVFSESAEVICEELYDFLCLEGFLDLPVNWRVSLQEEAP
jgi:hypothetical protein